jgi:hypothetical protein
MDDIAASTGSFSPKPTAQPEEANAEGYDTPFAQHPSTNLVRIATFLLAKCRWIRFPNPLPKLPVTEPQWCGPTGNTSMTVHDKHHCEHTG